ncbi:MAG: sigma-70 family RNA polymerase sigma factor [Phycisphaerales bacterium]|nr:sigma-70 family RNA polymerase sigma factor [Phycisphaerales bacterium]
MRAALGVQADESPEGDLELARCLSMAASGDEAAWRAIIDRYARRVFALARSRCRSAEAAEEITQSVFVTVATKLQTGAYVEKGRFESWLFRVAMNRVRDEARRAARRGPDRGDDALASAPAPPADGGRAPGLGALRRAMEQLNEADRDIIQLRHHAGLSFKTMSELLNEPVGTLLARHHRALRKLRQMLEGKAGGGDVSDGLGPAGGDA